MANPPAHQDRALEEANIWQARLFQTAICRLGIEAYRLLKILINIVSWSRAPRMSDKMIVGKKGTTLERLPSFRWATLRTGLILLLALIPTCSTFLCWSQMMRTSSWPTISTSRRADSVNSHPKCSRNKWTGLWTTHSSNPSTNQRSWSRTHNNNNLNSTVCRL